METVILSIHDIRAIVRQVGIDDLMDAMIERLQSAFRRYDATESVTPVRAGFHYTEPQLGLIEWMSVMKVGKSATG